MGCDVTFARWTGPKSHRYQKDNTVTDATFPVTSLAMDEELRLAASTAADGARTLRLAVPGMNCGGCVASIEAAARAVPGVEQARANLTRKSLTASWRGTAGCGGDILAALQQVGFDAFPMHAEDADTLDGAVRRDLIMRMAVAGFASANIMLLSVSVWAGASDATRDLLHWISALIAIPTVVYAGRPFFSSAWSGLKARRLNMDAPISLAVILATVVSLSEVLHGGEDAYFDAAVMLLFLLLIGRWIDRMMRDKARSAAQALGRLAPRGAWVVEEDETRAYRAMADLRPGDRVALNPGERLSVDGTVLSGVGTIDAALVTGESLPVAVRPGDRVEAGVLNLDGALIVEASSAGEDTSLTEITRLCAAAEDRKSRLARLADKAAAIYAPVIHVIAMATMTGWVLSGSSVRDGLLAAVAVLIVTCPCALGLAAPMAQAVASGALFRRGIMLKDGTALERLALVDHAVFDKTGVLTYGELSVTDAGGLQGPRLSHAVGLALRSTHPVARALVRHGESAGARPATVRDIHEESGFGLTGIVDGRSIRLGSADHCGVVDEPVSSDVTCWFADGETEPLCIRFSDTVREDAGRVVAALTAGGLRTSLLSGDHSQAVKDVGSEVGIERTHSRQTPQDKIARVEAYQEAGEVVLMIGDGINDAPALSAATVSMAPSSGSDIGRTASDLVFTGGTLSAVTEAWQMARRARRVILQNFALAAGYNLIAIPIAALGYAGPLVAAIAMSSSSLLVTLNALRLSKGSSE